jgi:hypothetical protein
LIAGLILSSFVELYRDKFIDLLEASNRKKKRLPSEKAPKIEIREDSKTRSVFLDGSGDLRTTVTSAAQAVDLINRGNQSRTVGSTLLNENSSRSHSILIVHIERRDSTIPNAPVYLGKLNIVDLAGSERVSKSGAEGETLKETQKINSSLSALGDVLAALSSPNFNGPVPYRNSKLTRILQDSLGGNSKTFFVVNVPTTAETFQETLMSLSYGQRAKKIRNMTSLNRDTNEESDVHKLYLEIEELRRRLVERTKQFEKLKQVDYLNEAENLKLRKQLDMIEKLNSEDITHLEHQMEDVIHSHTTKFMDMKFSYAQLREDVEAHKKRINELQLDLFREEDEKEKLAAHVKEYEQKMEFLESENQIYRDNNDRLSGELQKIQSEFKKIRRSSTSSELEAELAQMKKKTEQQEEIRKKLEKEVKDLKSELSKKDQEIEALQGQNEELAQKAKKSKKTKSLDAPSSGFWASEQGSGLSSITDSHNALYGLEDEQLANIAEAFASYKEWSLKTSKRSRKSKEVVEEEEEKPKSKSKSSKRTIVEQPIVVDSEDSPPKKHKKSPSEKPKKSSKKAEEPILSASIVAELDKKPTTTDKKKPSKLVDLFKGSPAPEKTKKKLLADPNQSLLDSPLRETSGNDKKPKFSFKSGAFAIPSLKSFGKALNKENSDTESPAFSFRISSKNH